MKITNKYNLPEPIYKAVSDVYPPKDGRLSVTRLIDAPLVSFLLKKHWDELEEDASEKLWALLGKSMDNILTKNAPPSWTIQRKIEQPYNGIVIVGRIDYLDTVNAILGDWKATSVWSYIFGGRAEWEKQLNLYDWLLQQKGLRAKKLVAQRLFRDHQSNKAKRDPDYPPIPFMSLDIPQWTPEQQEEYVAERVKLHQSEPTECTPEEKWEKPTTYAVMKKGRKSALRVLDFWDDAWKWCVENGHIHQEPYDEHMFKDELDKNIEIIERKGECVRCNSYCSVRSVCPYRKETK